MTGNWPPHPALYEINTWAWLTNLRGQYQTPLDLSSVPAAEWDAIAAFGFSAVWLMGVWERSPAGIAIANRNPGLLEDFRRALPDFRVEDNVGSPYCIRQYQVDPRLGGADGLAVARRELARRGTRLILDFVPNHVAPDHPWVTRHPDYFIRGTADDARNHPASYMEVQGSVFARGRDPYFPPWPDVLQLNAFAPGLRQAVLETIANIARQCDGIRCDMAMLVLNSIFQRTWGDRAGPRPAAEYWAEVIPAVKQAHPNFLFMAEAYWDLEWELQQQGFDYCYDKRLYDRLAHENAESVRLHLCAGTDYQERLIRFIENHDEPRAAAVFSPARERAAAVTMATTPGASLFHEGQLEGRKVKLPVFLCRRPEEPVDERLKAFYTKLLEITARPVFYDGDWTLCERRGWPDNPSFENLVAWTWTKGDDRCLIAVNLSGAPVQARIQLPWLDLKGESWQLTDALSAVSYDRDGDEMQDTGLYVELAPWDYSLFECRRAHRGVPALAQPEASAAARLES
jgi:hypothetical protein